MAWKWTKARQKAARLAADGAFTNDQIAAQVGISPQGYDKWLAASEFRTRVAEIVGAYAEAIKDEGIANVKNRVAAQNDRWRRMQRIIDQRAADPTMAGVPGGDTGLVVPQAKLVKVYDAAPGREGADGETLRSAKRDVLVYEYAADTALVAEMRAHEKQASQELGQWREKSELATKDGKPLAVANIAFDFAAFERAFASAAGMESPVPDDPDEPVDTASADR